MTDSDIFFMQLHSLVSYHQSVFYITFTDRTPEALSSPYKSWKVYIYIFFIFIIHFCFLLFWVCVFRVLFCFWIVLVTVEWTFHDVLQQSESSKTSKRVWSTAIFNSYIIYMCFFSLPPPPTPHPALGGQAGEMLQILKIKITKVHRFLKKFFI